MLCILQSLTKCTSKHARKLQLHYNPHPPPRPLPHCPQLRIDVNTFLYVQVFQPLGLDAVPVLTQCYTPKVFNTTLEVPIGGSK